MANIPQKGAVAPVEIMRSLATLSDKRIDILRRIGETGSISEAARVSGVSYKAAWQALETLENLAGGRLVEKEVGGNRGGGTCLTPVGEQVLMIADRLSQARAEIFSEFSNDLQSIAGSITSSGILTSMRNTLPCVVDEVAHGPALVRVYLKLDGENRIRSSITQESAQLLGVSCGMRMVAAFKATAVEIAASFPEERAGNRIRGKVIRCARSEKGGEVTILLPSGLTVVGFARHDHGLELGSQAEAMIEPSVVVLARAV